MSGVICRLASVSRAGASTVSAAAWAGPPGVSASPSSPSFLPRPGLDVERTFPEPWSKQNQVYSLRVVPCGCEQCCGSGLDPDPDWIRIRIVSLGVPGFASGSGSRSTMTTHKHRKKLINLICWSTGCSLLRVEGFFYSLDIINLQFFYQKCYKKNFCCIVFFSFWSSKSWIRIGSWFNWNAVSAGSTALVASTVKGPKIDTLFGKIFASTVPSQALGSTHF